MYTNNWHYDNNITMYGPRTHTTGSAIKKHLIS